MKKTLYTDRFRNSSITTAITVVVTILLLVLNAVIAELSDKANLSIDLTTDNIYSLSDESKAFFSKLDKTVNIHVLVAENSLASGNQYTAQVYQILNSCDSFQNITVDYTDIVLNPTFVQKYPDYTLTAGDVIVECDDRIMITSVSDMLKKTTTVDYSTLKQTTEIEKSEAEQILANAIMFVSTDDLVKITFLTGFSDADYDGFMQLLTKNSFEVYEQSLITEDIDPKATVAVLYGVKNELTEDALKKFDIWLDHDGEQGKTLMIFADTSAENNENMNAFLKDWGLRIGEGIAVETDAKRYYYYPYYPVAEIRNEILSKTKSRAGNPIVMALSKPVFQTGENASFKVSELLSLADTSAVLNSDNSVSTAHELCVMAMSEHTNYGEKTNISSVIVSGSYQAFSSTLLTDNSFSNAEYILELLNKVTGRENTVTITPKSFTDTRHAMNISQIYFRAVLFIVILPLAISVVGVTVWLKRRNK